MRKYEIIFIVRPDMEEEDLAKLVTQMEGVVAGAGGKIEKVGKDGPPPARLSRRPVPGWPLRSLHSGRDG